MVAGRRRVVGETVPVGGGRGRRLRARRRRRGRGGLVGRRRGRGGALTRWRRRGTQHARRHGRRRHGGGGLDRDPSGVRSQVDLGPDVSVRSGHGVGVAGPELARGEAHGEAGRDAEGAGQHRVGAGELLAEAGLGDREELDQGIGAAGGRRRQGVAEPAGAEPVDEGLGLADRGGRTSCRLAGQLGDDGRLGGQGEVGRQAGVGGRQLPPVGRHGRTEPGGDGVRRPRPTWDDGQDPLLVDRLRSGQPVHRQGVRRGGEQPADEVGDRHVGVEGARRGGRRAGLRDRERPLPPAWSRRVPRSAPAVGTHSVPVKEDSVPTSQ